ncbi:MAG: hypothetical protein NC548_10655 [Lachnospiraceae bacterium]|nr:hypothetical protein [Lachnospiraceae bacterium]
MKKVVVLLAFVLLLTACGNNELSLSLHDSYINCDISKYSIIEDIACGVNTGLVGTVILTNSSGESVVISDITELPNTMVKPGSSFSMQIEFQALDWYTPVLTVTVKNVSDIDAVFTALPIQSLAYKQMYVNLDDIEFITSQIPNKFWKGDYAVQESEYGTKQVFVLHNNTISAEIKFL